MPRHNTSHPGKLILHKYLKPRGLTGRELAEMLQVSASTLSRILDGTSAISPEMALRLSKVLGRTARNWLELQIGHDLNQASLRIKLAGLRRLQPATARRRLGGVKMAGPRTKVQKRGS